MEEKEIEKKEIEKKEIETKKIKGKKFSDLKVLVSRKKTMIAAIVLIVVILFAFKVFAAEKTEESVQDNIVTVEVEEAKMTDSMAGLSYKFIATVLAVSVPSAAIFLALIL